MVSARDLAPRDPKAASRSAAGMCAVAGLLTGFVAVVSPLDANHVTVIVSFAIPVALVLMAGLVYSLPESWRPAVCLVAPLLGVVSVMMLDLATRDASAAAQVFFGYPVLFAASRLRRLGAWTVLAAALASGAVVAFVLEPVGRAVTDVTYVGVTLIALTALLSRAGERQDELVARLSKLAMVDPLTGLLTRRALDEATTVIAAKAGHDGTSMILVDLDRFKDINDTYGHPVGDDVLVHVATIISSHARRDSVIGRIGGDEIAVLLPGCSEDVAARRAVELVEAIRKSPLALSDGTAVPVSISVGVAHVPRYAGEFRVLYLAADAALYQAKRAGRDRVGRLLPASGSRAT